ncbi:hypothetical protein JCM19296_3568 [Nonlabens ulvanivorans]|uniref:DUF4304 domain-containing protein n=1 Tax=Nonlabens ulvanivorans TaxID=906888 RepID=A0A081DGB3_NONUL|nr:DUF4304 domain-containing protein [Nonlabens ulvanivorans]GAK77959.1 hypothetical protein JCM19296_3568 [Nonlabens ulvanivorans]
MTNKIEYKKILNEIQKLIHTELKADGFKKKGRTHNKVLDNGIVQVINFQMGQFQFDNVIEIPGLRENLYGQFTINIGVFVPELYEKIFDPKPKNFIQEYDCEIRTRLSQKIFGEDKWFPITADFGKTAEFIIENLNSIGKEWFDRFDNRKKIIVELTQSKVIEFSPRQKLSGAIIELGIDRENGERIFNEYYNSIEEKKPHKKFVIELAKKLKIK